MSDVNRRAGWGASIAAVVAVAGCAHRPPMILTPVQASCHSVVPAPAPAVTWVAPGEARDLERLSEWCRTVGPVLVESPEEGSPPAVVESLAILTWNVHVGGGDVEEVVARLRGGILRKAAPYRTSRCFSRKRTGRGVTSRPMFPMVIPSHGRSSSIHRPASGGISGVSRQASGFTFYTYRPCATARPL